MVGERAAGVLAIEALLALPVTYPPACPSPSKPMVGAEATSELGPTPRKSSVGDLTDIVPRTEGAVVKVELPGNPLGPTKELFKWVMLGPMPTWPKAPTPVAGVEGFPKPPVTPAEPAKPGAKLGDVCTSSVVGVLRVLPGLEANPAAGVLSRVAPPAVALLRWEGVCPACEPAAVIGLTPLVPLAGSGFGPTRLAVPSWPVKVPGSGVALLASLGATGMVWFASL
jgi:hypothetical protein